MLSCGDVLAGDYVIESLIGKGGMGCVYRAHVESEPGVLVAVKELPMTVRLASGGLLAQGVSSQMSLMKRIHHQGIARLFEAFRWDDFFYLVFEYVEGRSLQSIVAYEGAQPERTVMTWAKVLTDILAYLHGLTPPVVYRDMKPSNVLLDAKGSLKLIDLGIAREFKNAALQDKDTVAFGTQGYAPPEQYGCAQTDARSDIYALGCTLWHLLAGFPPPMEFPLPDIRTVNDQVSEECQALIARCTQLDREKRYQTCAALASDIDRLLKGKTPGGPAQRLAVAFRQLMKPWGAAASCGKASPEDLSLLADRQDFFWEDVPTTLLMSAADVSCRVTGELSSHPVCGDEFFFVVVQSEVVVHDGEVSK